MRSLAVALVFGTVLAVVAAEGHSTPLAASAQLPASSWLRRTGPALTTRVKSLVLAHKTARAQAEAVGTPQAAAQAGYDGGWRFCRIRFRTSPEGDGAGWYVDYPRADENLSIRLSQLTKFPVTTIGEGDPVHIVLRLTDAELYQCPFIMMTEPGGAEFDAAEAKQLGDYLKKGGFLWADDFWGSHAWEWWSQQMAKALPANEYPIVDVPMDHPMYHTLFDIKEIPQIPNIGLWESSHITSERGDDSPQAYGRAIFDKKGRLMVYMTFDTDFGDSFEREGEAQDYFLKFSVPAYEIASDVLIYAFTH